MSFWPFSISLNNHTQLQKFLDSVQDISTVTVDDLLSDTILSQELVSELHDIKGNYNNNISNLQFSQSQKSESNSSNSDIASISSSNNENNGLSNISGRDNRGVKLLELLLQPHILTGFLDYIVQSVEFYYNLDLEERKKLEKLIRKDECLEENSDLRVYDKNNNMKDNDLKEFENFEITSEGDKEENDEDRMRRYFQVSAEILSIDLWVISNRIIETPIIISKLWSVLSLPNLKENSPSVSYIIQILDQLLETNSIEFFNFIRRQSNLADIIIDKIEIPILVDFFLKVIQSDKVDSPTGILDTVSSQNLIPKLIEILKPDPLQFESTDEIIPNSPLFFKQTSVTDFIKTLITISSNTALAVVLESNVGPNQLTRELVSPKIVNIMINDIMLFNFSKCESPGFITNKYGINNCVSIVIELIRKNNSDYDTNCGTYTSIFQSTENPTGEVDSYSMFQWLKDFEQNPPGPRDPIYLGDMLELFSENLDKFTKLMELDPDPILNLNKECLGFSKFKISELIAELLHCSNMILLNSNKLRKIVKIRDAVRLQQNKRLQDALNENLSFDVDREGEDFIDNVTNTFDYIILDDNLKENENSRMAEILESIANDDDSEDEEPLISTDNPFVCKARDERIRENPFVGDYFKIKLIDSGLLTNIILKFTKYKWHNFFHNVVFDLVQQIFNGKLNSYNSFLIVELFDTKKCNLTNLIVESYTEDLELRPGYMGHLILISEEIVKFTSLYKPDLISPIIVESISSNGWEWFVNETLLKTREAYNVVLGAEHGEDSNNINEEERYGFDSSTVGYLDMDTYDNQPQKNVIVLGDSSNHDLFINDNSISDTDDQDNQDDYKNEIPENPTMSFSKLKALSPKLTISHEDFSSSFDEKYSNNLPGHILTNNSSDSNSSDEENETDASHELKRVQKHHE